MALELQKALRFFPERAWNRTLRTSGLEKTHDRVWGCQNPRKRDWTKNCGGTWTCLARQGSRNNFQERRKKETELSIRYTKLDEDHQNWSKTKRHGTALEYMYFNPGGYILSKRPC